MQSHPAGKQKQGCAVYRTSFGGSHCVVDMADYCEAANFLVRAGAYGAPVASDAGYFVELEDGRRLEQGTAALNTWIEAHNDVRTAPQTKPPGNWYERWLAGAVNRS